MKPSTVFVAAVSATTVSASPLNKRDMGGVLMCTGANATGTCKYQKFTMGDCHQLKKPFHQNINTFAPDGEEFECFPRVNDCGGLCTSPTGCTFGAVDFNYENKYNLSAIEWNTLFKSFDCAKKTKN